MLGSHIGAPAASPRTRPVVRRATAIALAAVAVASLAAAPAVSATTSAPAPSGAVALTTTTVDKPWYSVERFYLGLLNCTRTGGWVLSDGTCRGYGSGRYSAYVAPIAYSYGLSDKVARPYAKLLVLKGLCTHFYGGTDPGSRLRVAGYTRWTWAENIGCRDGYSSAKAAVLATHLRFQAEKSTNGGHWRNIKASKYRSVGIGIWRYGTRTRLVTDFYG